MHHYRRSHLLTGPVLAASLVLAAVGCSRDTAPPPFRQPPVDSFAAGPCTTMAPAILSIGRDAQQLSTTPSQAVLDRLTTAQATLRTQQADLQPLLQTPVADLVATVGVVRLRARIGSYAPALAQEVRVAYQRLIDVCVPTADPGNGY